MNPRLSELLDAWRQADGDGELTVGDANETAPRRKRFARGKRGQRTGGDHGMVTLAPLAAAGEFAYVDPDAI